MVSRPVSTVTWGYLVSHGYNCIYTFEKAQLTKGCHCSVCTVTSGDSCWHLWFLESSWLVTGRGHEAPSCRWLSTLPLLRTVLGSRAMQDAHDRSLKTAIISSHLHVNWFKSVLAQNTNLLDKKEMQVEIERIMLSDWHIQSSSLFILENMYKLYQILLKLIF